MANENRMLGEILLQIAGIDPVVAMEVDHLVAFMARDVAPIASYVTAAPAGNAGKVAVVPVQGPLMSRSFRGWSGTYPGMDSIRSTLRQHANDADVGAIVLDIDSPGGSVAGTMETAQAVRDAASQKPVIAIANTLAASAAYWIGSQASEFVIAPSGDVGSIGAMILHQDVSGYLDKLGVKMTMIRSEQSPNKNEAHPFSPLSDDAQAFLQSRANDAGAEFVRAVATGRKTSQANVKEKFGQGRVYGAKDALARGMVDRVATLHDVIGSLMQKSTANNAKPASRRRSSLMFD